MEQTNQSMLMQKPTIIDSASLKLRLDTQDLLDRIEAFLRGGNLIIKQDKDGILKSEIVKFGRPKANDLGIQSVLSWIHMSINPHTVQGNFPVDKHGYSFAYETFIAEYQDELCNLLVLNCYNWGILDEEIEGIIASIMLMTQAFMSRLIGNEERKSYGETMHSIETNTSRGGGIPLFK